METLFYLRTSSPVGPLFLAASTKGLVRLEFEARMQKLNPDASELQPSKAVLAPYLRELKEYFAGERREFSIPLDLRGTEFQLACWHALLEIPYGETRSYRDIAASHWPSARLPGRRHVEQPESSRHRRPLPPGDRIERLTLRLRRRPRHQAQVARPGTGECFMRMLALVFH